MTGLWAFIRAQATTVLVTLVCVLNTVRYALTGEAGWAAVYGFMTGVLLVLLALSFFEGRGVRHGR